MGVVEAKLSAEADEPSPSSSSSPPPPLPTNSVDAFNRALVSLKLEEENPADGVGDPVIEGPDDDPGPDEDLESLKKGEEEEAAEEGVGPRFPHRPDEPDCTFYVKTGTCKFGSNCKFNHPLQKRRLGTAWARLKTQSDDVQATKDERDQSGSKMIGHATHNGAEEVKQTPSRRMKLKDHKHAVEKPNGIPLKKVEQTEKKAVQEEKQNPSIRMEQEDPKVKLKKQWKAVQVDENEKEIANNVVAAESEVVKDKQSPPQRMKQEDNKVVKEKQIPSDRMQHQDNKAAKKTSGETTAGKVGVTQCKAAKKTSGETTAEKVGVTQCKAAKKTSGETTAEKVGVTQCKAAKKMSGETTAEKVGVTQCKAAKKTSGETTAGKVGVTQCKAAKKTSGETTAEKVGVTQCKYHTMPGGCKFGKSCKYVHSQKKKEVHPVELNFLGLPIRPGEKECLIYVRTGNCKHAANCKYHHPDPTVATVQQDPLSGCHMQQIGFGVSPLPMMPNPTEGPFQGPTSFMVAPPSYSPGSNLHPQGLLSNSGCNGNQAAANGYPEGSSQLECQHFVKSGVCKFVSACQFHHPEPHNPANSSGTPQPHLPFA